MQAELKDYIDQYKPFIEDQLEYLKDNAWHLKKASNRLSEEEVQHNLAKNSLSKLVYFLGKTSREERLKYKTIQNFVELLSQPVFYYIDYSETYLKTHRDWKNIVDPETKISELTFQDNLIGKINNFNKKLKELNIENKLGEITIPIHSDKPIPLLMREVMESKFPEIIEYLKEKSEKEKASV